MQRNKTRYLLVLAGALIASNALAQVPRTISYQGVIADNNGLPIANGNKSITIKIYDAATGGTVVFTESQTVPVIRGLFNLIIGSTTPGGLPASAAFDKPYWLGLSVDGGPEFPQRTQLTSAPYAFRAVAADSAMNVAANSIGAANLRPNSVNVSKLDAASAATGQVLTSNGAGGAAFQPIGNIGVSTVNGQTGDIRILAGAGTTVVRNGKDITVNSTATGTISSVNSADAAIGITNPTGPSVTLSIRPNSITEPLLGDRAVITRVLDDAAVTNVKLAQNSVTGDKIVDGTITTGDLADNLVTSNKIIDGEVKTADLGDLAVTTAKLADNSVTTAKIPDGSITTPKLADGAVTTVKITDGAVNSAKILDGSIVNADVSGTAAIDYTKLFLTNKLVTADFTDNSVTTPKIADGGVNSAKILDGTVVNADVSPTAAIAYSKLALTNSIVTTDLTDNSVTTPKIIDGAVNTAKILDATILNIDISSVAAIAYSKLALTNSLVTGDLTDNAVTTPKIADGAVNSAKILDGTIVNADVSPTAAISYGKLALTNSIVTTDLTDNSVTTPKIADGAVNSTKILDGTIVNADVSPTAAIAYSKLNLTNSLVTADHVDASITLPKLSPTGAASGQAITYNGTTIVWGNPTPGGAAGGDLTGTYPNPTIAANAVTSAKILDGTIVNADVSPTAAIAYSKLALTNSIVTTDLTDNSVTTAKILDGTIVDADVSPTAAIAYGKLALNNSIQNGDLTANSVTTSKVANGTVTTSKLADSAVSGLKLLTNAVTTAHIADGSVTLPKISPTGASTNQSIIYNGTSIVWGSPTPAGAAGGDLTGTYPNPTIANNAITSAKILDGTIVDADVSPTAAIAYGKLALNNSIQNGDIVANAITTSKVANGTVTTSKLADSAVSGLKLLTGAVNTAHIADGAVTDAKVANGISYSKLSGAPTSLPPSGAAGGDLTGTYPNPTIANNAITSAKILDGTIVDADVSPTAAIAYSKLNLTNSIQNGDIVANAITTSKVANGTVTTSKLADSAVSGLKLLTFAVTNRHIADNAVTLPKIDPTGATTNQVITYNGTSVVWAGPAGASGAAGGDLTGTYPNPTLAANSVLSSTIADGNVQNQDLAANSVTTSKVANGTVTTSKMADSAISGLKLLTFAVTNRHIADNAVTLPKIDPTGANTNDVITYNGTSVVWSAPVSGITTNATLTGAGTVGSPLGVNLGNSNTWTANQTFGGTFLITANSRIAMTNSDNNARDIRFQEPSGTGSQYIGLRAPSVTNNGNYLFPAVVGSVGQVMTLSASNGIDSATMAWTTITATGTAGGDLTGTYPNPTVANNAITSAKILDGTIQGADIASGTFTTTNAHHALGNNDNTARELRFLEPSGSGVNYTAFKAQAQAGDITYTLPNTAPTAANQVLQVQAVAGNNATLNWAAVGGGAILFNRTGVIANAGNTSYNVVAADDIIGVDMSAGTNFTVNLQPATTVGEILIIKIEKYNNALLPVLTIQPNGTDKIDGNNNIAFGNAGGNRRLYSDGAGNWYGW